MKRESEGGAGRSPAKETGEEAGQGSFLPGPQLAACGRGPKSHRESQAPQPGTGLANRALDSRFRTGQLGYQSVPVPEAEGRSITFSWLRYQARSVGRCEARSLAGMPTLGAHHLAGGRAPEQERGRRLHLQDSVSEWSCVDGDVKATGPGLVTGRRDFSQEKRLLPGEGPPACCSAGGASGMD